VTDDTTSAQKPMHVLVLYPELFASPIVNILTPLRHLAEQGAITLDHGREDGVTPQQVRAADVLVTCRSVSPTVKPVYDYAMALGIPIIYDLDDNLFAVPPDSAPYRYFGHPDKQKQLRWMIAHADLVRAHSPTLSEVIRPMNARVAEVWAAVDWSLAPDALPVLREPLRIVYAVSPYSGAMFYSIIRDDLKRLLEDHGERVHFTMLGYKEPALAKLPNCTYVPFETDYAKFFRDFTRAGYAIGLAPMKHDLFYQCKTDLKFRDYAAAGAAGVYTDSPLYRQVEDGVTGIIVRNEPGAWYAAIEGLLNDRHKLETMRQQARDVAFRRYHVDSTSQQWLAQLQSVERRPAQPGLAHPEAWAFTRTDATGRKWLAAVKRAYHRVAPFRVHVLISRVYHRVRGR
jgi:glycosyltransferase involved in cell wall biosynthesis